MIIFRQNCSIDLNKPVIFHISIIFFRRGDAVFFIYDHNMLKKEEDDLKDAILFFTPDNV
jgi:hypothetical protein